MTKFNYSCVFNEENKLQWGYFKQGTEKSQTVGLIAHTWGLYSLSWLTGLFKSNSNAPMTLNHVVFSATESPFSFKIQNSHITIQGEALRGRLYLFIGTKANFSFPSSPWIVLLMLMGFISASWEEAGEWFSIHMLQFTPYLLWQEGQQKLWSPGPVFISVLDSSVLWADTTWGIFHPKLRGRAKEKWGFWRYFGVIVICE